VSVPGAQMSGSWQKRSNECGHELGPAAGLPSGVLAVASLPAQFEQPHSRQDGVHVRPAAQNVSQFPLLELDRSLPAPPALLQQVWHMWESFELPQRHSPTHRPHAQSESTLLPDPLLPLQSAVSLPGGQRPLFSSHSPSFVQRQLPVELATQPVRSEFTSYPLLQAQPPELGDEWDGHELPELLPRQSAVSLPAGQSPEVSSHSPSLVQRQLLPLELELEPRQSALSLPAGQRPLFSSHSPSFVQRQVPLDDE